MDLRVSDRGQPYLVEELAFGEDLVAIIARNVRRDRGVVKAWIGITVNGADMSHDDMHVDLDRDITHLANSVHTQFPKPVQNAFDKRALKYKLGTFCMQVWDSWNSQHQVVMLAGDPNVPPMTWIVKPYIGWETATVLFGAPGQGKSQLAMSLAVSMDAAKELIDPHRIWPCDPVRVCYVNMERSQRSMVGRLARVNLALGLEADRPICWLQARGMGLKEIEEALYRDVRKYGIDVVFLDSLSRTGLGDLNENQTGNRIIDVLNAIVPTWFAIGHTPRNDNTHLYGSVMFDAGEDLGVSIASEQRQRLDGMYELGMVTQLRKGNDTGRHTADYYRLTFDEGGLTGIGRATEKDYPELVDTKDLPLVEQLRYAIHSAGGMISPTRAAQAVNGDRTKISKLFNESDQFVFVRAEGKERLYGLAERRVQAPRELHA